MDEDAVGCGDNRTIANSPPDAAVRFAYGSPHPTQSSQRNDTSRAGAGPLPARERPGLLQNFTSAVRNICRGAPDCKV